jgi:hypothetical protein
MDGGNEQKVATKFCFKPGLSARETTVFAQKVYGSGFGGLMVSMLASGTRVHGFIPGPSHRIFSGEKILSMPSFRREVKPIIPCDLRESRNHRQN